MTDNDDWDFENEEETNNSRKVQIMVLAAILITASVGSFLILREDDDGFPSEVNAPKLQIGMDWWYHVEENVINHHSGSNETDDRGDTMMGIIEITSYGGKEAYAFNWFDVIRTTTRHSSNHTEYMSVENLNGLDDDGNEYVVYDFPLKDGKQWNWIDDDENNRTYVCRAFRDVKTLDGTYDTYRVRINWSEGNDEVRFEYRNDYYYSPELGYMVKAVFRSVYYDSNDLNSTKTFYYNLVSHGTSDSDGDRLSDRGETWFGSDPEKKDTDLDGLDDLMDMVPLFDIGVSVNLTQVSTDEDVESIEETTVFGEEEGADFYFDLSNNDNDDVLVSDIIEDSDTSDLDIVYRIDISDDIYFITVDVRCFDADDGNADDVMDITMDPDWERLLLDFNIYQRSLEIRGVDPPDNELELDVEQEVYGDGGGDYDATLRFTFSEVNMEDYN